MEDQINTFNNQRILPELEIKSVASNSSNKLPPPLNWQQSYEPITVNAEPINTNLENLAKISMPTTNLSIPEQTAINELITDVRNVTGEAVSDINISI